MADDKSNEFAKERAKQKAQQRLSQISGGDLTRGLGGPAKSKSTISDVVATAKKKTTESKSTTSKSTATAGTTALSKNSKENQVKTKNKKLEKELSVSGAIDTITVTASRGRERRNKLIISILAISIALVWGFIIIASLIKPAGPDHNFTTHLSGDKQDQVTVLLNGKEHSNWKLEPGLKVGSNYDDRISLKISSSGTIVIKFRVEVFVGKKQIKEFGSVEIDEIFERTFDENDIQWFEGTFTAPTEQLLFNRISFVYSSRYPEMKNLTSDTVKIKLYISAN